MALSAALDAAEDALARHDHAAAVATLVEAWALTHNARIAELVSRVSASAPTRPAIAEKTVAASLAAWHAVEQAHDVLDVDRLLAAPWPAKWREGLPRLQRLVTWPDDPRVAHALHRLLTDPPYTSQASYWFQHAVVARLFELDDHRARAALTATVERLQGYASFRSLGQKLGALRTGDPPLDADALACVERLEARFVTAVRDERTSKKTVDDFLGAIWAAPDDRSLKSIFADWLTEQGNPRGELMALGLARAPGAGPTNLAAERRERSLIATVADDHQAWDWPVVELFEATTLRYEDGFFAGGVLSLEPTEALAQHPAWSHVRVIELANPDVHSPDFLHSPRVRLRALYGLNVAHAGALLAEGALVTLETLELAERPWPEPPAGQDAGVVATAEALPRLRHFGLSCAPRERVAVDRFAGWPVLQRVETFCLRDGGVNVAELLEVLTASPSLRAVELRQGQKVGFLEREPTFRFSRQAGGVAFSALVVRAAAPLDFYVAVRALGELPAGSLQHLQLELGRRALRAEELELLVETLDRFPGLEVDPPLARRAPAPAPERTAPTLPIDFTFSGTSLCAPERLPRALALATELGLSFDSFRVGYGAHRKLGTRPAEQLATWAKKRSELKVYADGGIDELDLGKGEPARTTFAGAISHQQASRLVDFVGARCDDLELVWGRVVVNQARLEADDPFGVWGGSPGWLLVASGHWGEWLSDAALTSLRTVAELSGLTFTRTARNLLITVTASALETPTQPQLEAFAAGLRRLVDDEWARRRGYRWRELGAQLATTARTLGLSDTTAHEAHERHFALTLGDRRRLQLRLRSPFGEPTLHAELQVDGDVGYWPHALGEFLAGTAALAQKAIAEVSRLAVEQGPGFFAAHP